MNLMHSLYPPQLQLVRREMAWEAEKHAIALDKLHTWLEHIASLKRPARLVRAHTHTHTHSQVQGSGGV